MVYFEKRIYTVAHIERERERQRETPKRTRAPKSKVYSLVKTNYNEYEMFCWHVGYYD
jgi:hypothetical protein